MTRSLCTVALLALAVGGCGARTQLPVGSRGEGGAGGASAVPSSCRLRLGLAPARVFPESTANSESVFSSFTATKEGDRACLASFLKEEGAASYTLHARCMSAFGAALDRGPDLVLGGPLPDDSLIPPADLLVAVGAPSGFALLYGNYQAHVFGPSMSTTGMTLPTAPVTPDMQPLRLGPAAKGGHTLVYGEVGTGLVAAGRIDASGAVSPIGELFCATNNRLTVKLAHLDTADLATIVSAGEMPPSCTPSSEFASTVLVRAIGPAAPISTIAAVGYVSAVDITPFGGDHAFVVFAENASGGALLEAAYVDATGAVERRFVLGPYSGGFGVSAAELAGSLLVVVDAPRTPGDMGSAGFDAMLVDPTSGVVTSRLSIPLDGPLVDSPTPPVLVRSSAGDEALLGFFAQPLGTGGRDYVARIDCVGP